MCSLAHPKVVNSAYFSPVSGAKLMSTCIDNRLRVWDSWLGQREAPSREIVHSHDFNRCLPGARLGMSDVSFPGRVCRVKGYSI